MQENMQEGGADDQLYIPYENALEIMGERYVTLYMFTSTSGATASAAKAFCTLCSPLTDRLTRSTKIPSFTKIERSAAFFIISDIDSSIVKRTIHTKGTNTAWQIFSKGIQIRNRPVDHKSSVRRKKLGELLEG